jgi:hypothetical protein
MDITEMAELVDFNKGYNMYFSGNVKRFRDVKDYYKNVFVKDILAKHIFFYYSNKNINKQILSLYTKQMPRAECKTHYIP